MNARVRQTTLSDLKEVADNMRQRDVDEITAATGMTPKDALMFSRAVSHHCMTVVVNDHPIAISGVVGAPHTAAIIWMLGTDGVAKFRQSFTKVAKENLKGLLAIYPLLYNWVDNRNRVSLSWLKRNGATIHDPEPWGRMGMMFRKFELRGTGPCASRQ